MPRTRPLLIPVLCALLLASGCSSESSSSSTSRAEASASASASASSSGLFFQPEASASSSSSPSSSAQGSRGAQASASPKHYVDPSQMSVNPLQPGWSTTGASSVDASGRATCVDVAVPADKMFSAEAPDPSDLVWDTTGNAVITFPLSRSQGPMYRPKYTGQCYAHTPVGAAFAVMNYSAATGDTRMSRSEAAVLLSQKAVSQANTKEPTPDPNKMLARTIGYTVDSYAVNEANIRIYMYLQRPNSDDVMVSHSFTAVWEDGDWKLVDPEGKFNGIAKEKPQHYLKWSS